jgi:hypothetical protein
LVLKEYYSGWQHKQGRKARENRLDLVGWSSLVMCFMYLGTDMSGLAEVSLPTNPGGVFKSSDIAAKSKVR